MKIAVLTSDTHAWLLRGFLHQWRKYDGRQIEIVGFTHPGHDITKTHKFVSLGDFADYPLPKWSDAVIKYLESINDELVEIWLEDYWLMRYTNQDMVSEIFNYMSRPESSDILRFDLATDRLYAANVQDAGALWNIDIVEAKGQYSLSWQVNIWNRKILLSMMRPGENPWESELKGTERVNLCPLRVLGSRNGPVRYMIAVNKGKLDRTGAWMYPPRTLSEEDWQELDKLGYTVKP